MFHRTGRKAKLPNAKPLKDLTAVVPPAQLLGEGRRQELIKNINEHCFFDPSRFENLCLSLINNLANHCQSIPETSNSYFAMAGGLIDHALNRTEAALSLFRQYVVVDEKGDLTEEQKLWLYALFSAGILQGIGKLQMDYRIEVFDDNGQLIKECNPLLESLASVGSYYLFEFLQEGEDDLRRRLNLLMARLLMPASGFTWIASNPQVLAVWLALLNEDARGAGTLGAILIRANALAIARYFNESMSKGLGGRGGRLGRMSTFVDSTPESIIEKERLMGIEFIKWMTTKLESGQIMINKAPLLSVPGGLIMSVEMFKWFVREHPEYKNWQAAQHAFLTLGLHGLGTDGGVISRYEQAHNQQMISGIVFADYAVALPNEMQIHNLNTGKVSTISATEFIHMAQFNNQFNRVEQGNNPGPLTHLHPSGQWMPPTEIQQHNLAFESHNRG